MAAEVAGICKGEEAYLALSSQANTFVTMRVEKLNDVAPPTVVKLGRLMGPAAYKACGCEDFGASAITEEAEATSGAVHCWLGPVAQRVVVVSWIERHVAKLGGKIAFGEEIVDVLALSEVGVAALSVPSELYASKFLDVVLHRYALETIAEVKGEGGEIGVGRTHKYNVIHVDEHPGDDARGGIDVAKDAGLVGEGNATESYEGLGEVAEPQETCLLEAV